MSLITRNVEFPPDPEFLLEKLLSLLYVDIQNGLKTSSLPRGELYAVMVSLEDKDSTITMTYTQEE
jgi:hypothetical protein